MAPTWLGQRHSSWRRRVSDEQVFLRAKWKMRQTKNTFPPLTCPSHQLVADRSLMKNPALPFAVFVLLSLAACSTGPQGVRIINNSPPPAAADKTVEPIRDLAGAEITSVLIGKTFQYTRKGASGFVVYNADGTLKVKDDKTGASIGKWTVNGSQYCETYSVTQAMECGTFKSTGNAYFAANTRIEDLRDLTL